MQAPYLCMPDLEKLIDAERIAAYFTIRKKSDRLPEQDPDPDPKMGSQFEEIEVDFLGDAEQFRANHFLTSVDVRAEVNEVMPDVRANVTIYVQSLNSGLSKIEVPISKSCKNCEFRIGTLEASQDTSQDRRDGFKECWGDLAEVDPHILDLYQGGRVGGNETPLVNALIKQGKTSLYDMPIGSLEDTAYLPRQLIQISHTLSDREWISEHLDKVMRSFQYPLHFIDFETAYMPIPFHFPHDYINSDANSDRAGKSSKNIRPNEHIAFQWSCHTITSPDAPPIHSDWLQVGDTFPNFRFAETLMDRLGDDGTVFTWATHENSVLRHIYYQMEHYAYHNHRLKSWLNGIVKFKSGNKSRLVDMNALTLKHYFHPKMKGKTALKNVLPAVWTTNPYLHQMAWLSEYFKLENGKVLSPYDVLTKTEISQKSMVIKEGTGAMTAYLEMLMGNYQEDEITQQKWQDLLRQYCRLDTMAMVIIWTHWHYLVAKT